MDSSKTIIAQVLVKLSDLKKKRAKTERHEIMKRTCRIPKLIKILKGIA